MLGVGAGANKEETGGEDHYCREKPERDEPVTELYQSCPHTQCENGDEDELMKRAHSFKERLGIAIHTHFHVTLPLEYITPGRCRHRRNTVAPSYQLM